MKHCAKDAARVRGPDSGRSGRAAWAVSVVVAFAASTVGASPDFAREVRPILSNRCFKCHGPDADRQEAGLRLDMREAATAELDSGTRAIVPGHPDDSEIVARITSTDPDLVMPPPHTKVSLTEDEKRILTDWIAAGAEYKDHWAFVKPTKPSPPATANATWPRNEIDRFVLARLEQEGIAPAPEADKATLCRRVFLDLTGLPPSPAELDAFLADTSPEAYEKLIDCLLASPRYGERWARRWLDLARYADTNGYEKDRERSMWPWRDWVIRALNADMPFDQFTIRQIAGDLLPGATTDDIIATGFHRNTMINEEGGIDPLEFRYLAMVDRVGTTGATWLGLTTACAQCHTHKFDPILHTDYFGLMALLNNADEPEWTIPSPEQARRQAEIVRRIDEAWKNLPDKWPAPRVAPAEQVAGSGEPAPSPDDTPRAAADMAARFATWNRDETQRAVDWRISRPTTMTTNLPHLVLRDDSTVLVSGDITKSDVYELTLPLSATPVRAVRLEALPDASLPGHGPGLTAYEGPKGDFFLSEFEVTANGHRLAIAKATDSFHGKAAHSTSESTAAKAIDGDMSSGWSTNGEQGRAHAAVFQFAEPVPAGVPLVVTLRCERHFACGLGCFRLAVTDSDAAEARGRTADVEAVLVKPPETRTSAESRLVERSFLEAMPELAEPLKAIRTLEADLRGGTKTLVLRERPADNPRKTFRHHRGEFTQPKEEVAPATPAFLPQLPGDAPADRLALARWLVSSDNPLTARVTVNRHWQAFLGRGIVPSLEDFGYQSEPPSHPQLLDWLAATFMHDLGWSVKKLQRLIVTSATYRQTSMAPPQLLERDPQNVLLARGPRVRLEAEVIRDSMLKAAGILSEKMNGPGVRPPQPEGVTEVAYGNPKWSPSGGEDRYRRSIYTFQKRTAPFAMTTTFDGPTGEACVPRREVSNSALQALTLLNDPMFVEVAQAMGRAVMTAGPDDASRLRDLARRVLSREFDADEVATMNLYLAAQRQRLAAGELDARPLAGGEEADAAERAAWMLAARAVMNLDESIVKK
ncbi:MAG: PSD1 and planctomycete cytochrome C domain-containing protein [Planctomycetia bacterium]|nr:PSD1 and planctomycete cytochrome C domain-containing protein [Planctomycetia bacterium]